MADRLSGLPDDLLLRVLRFAPTKEAASTTALSRGWRSPLWRSSGAVNLETGVEAYNRLYGFDEREKQESDDEALFFSRRDAFVSAAEAALDAADVPVTRLAVRLEFHGQSDSANKFLYRDIDRVYRDRHRQSESDSHLLTKLISHPAARQVEELRLDVDDWRSHSDPYAEDKITSSHERGTFTLHLGSLPSDTLRVLELTGCKGLVPYPPASGLVFVRLTSLRLRHCTSQIDALQSLIDAAPALAAIHLECVTIVQQTNTSNSLYGCNRPPPSETVLLRCPAATVLELDGCCLNVKDRPWHTKNNIVAVEIDAPRLQRFRFRGIVRPVSLSPPPPDLAYADLHFVRRTDDKDENKIYLGDDRKKKSDIDPSRERDLMTFWRILHSFANAREMKLTVTALEHIAVLSKARRSELLPVLPSLHRLELEGVHRPKGKTAAVAIGNLLCCCPALRDLLVNLIVAHHEPKYRHSEDILLQRKFRSDRDKSICLFNRYCNSAPMTPPVEGIIAKGANYEEVSDIPGLTRRSFDCLRSSLTRVGLQFRLEDGNNFGVNLIKFFGENAMVLEEICIDGGNEKLGEHMTCKVERWIAESSIRTKPGAWRFVVLPLKR